MDKSTKVLIIVDLCLFIIIVSLNIFYYKLLESGYTHEESLLFGGLIGLVFASILSSIAVHKYIRTKHDENEIETDDL